MTSVRDASLKVLESHAHPIIFGNPGSTELPMIADLPAPWTYVLALQEVVAVSMADGHAQATGRPAVVSLHTAPGVGNAMGALFNARANRSPVIAIAGQQARQLMMLEANLTNRDAVDVPKPFVKWAVEPARAEDVPHALARAVHLAMAPPRGPVLVSVPMDDWAANADDAQAARLADRRVAHPSGAAARDIGELARDLAAARAPALVAGPGLDGEFGWAAAVALAERQRLAVWATPAPGGGRLGFPEDHPAFAGVLPPAVGPAGQTLAAYDLVIVAGSSAFPYYPNVPGPPLHDGTRLVLLTDDPDEAARAEIGDAIVGDPAAVVAALAVAPEPSAARTAPAPRPAPAPPADALDPAAAIDALSAALPPDARVVLEAPSATLAVRNRLRISAPRSYFFGAGGGLGFGLPAALGVQLADPSRPVVAVLGEGSAQYAIQALWTAATYDIPVTILILRNDEYAILRWFGGLEGLGGVPALDLPALDTAALSAAYGVPAERAACAGDLPGLLRDAFAAPGPRLIEVPVRPGMALV